jgi:hypothetical protein
MPPQGVWNHENIRSATVVLVECTLDDPAHVLHLPVQLDVPKKWTLDAIKDIVTHCLPSERGSPLRKRSYYEEVFQIYDLHQDGMPDAAIARQLWPEEFESKQRYGAHNPVLQRIHDRLEAAHKRMVFPPRQK